MAVSDARLIIRAGLLIACVTVLALLKDCRFIVRRRGHLAAGKTAACQEKC
jgi:hypothetical protein